MQSKHFKAVVVSSGNWCRTDGTRSDQDRTHAVPTDHTGRMFVQNLLLGLLKLEGPIPGAPGRATIDSTVTEALRLVAVFPEGDILRDVLDALDTAAERYGDSGPDFKLTQGAKPGSAG